MPDSKSLSFLNRVVEQQGDADMTEDIERVISRFKTLEDSNREQSNRKQKLEAGLKARREVLRQYKEAATDRILDFTSQVGTLQRKLEAMRVDYASAVKTVEEQNDAQRMSRTELGVLIMCVHFR